MNDDYVGRHIHRKIRRALLIGLGLLAISSVIWYFGLPSGRSQNDLVDNLLFGALLLTYLLVPIGGFLLIRGLMALLDRSFLRQLAKMGDPQVLRKQIDDEVRAGTSKYGDAIVTHNWILVPGWFGMKGVRFDDIFSSRLQETVTNERTGAVLGQNAVLLTKFGDFRVSMPTPADTQRFLSHVSMRREALESSQAR
jgi:hypothetical protein